MINFEALEKGISIDTLVPRWKSYLADLEGQRKKFEAQELEAGLGPEPTRSAMTLGAKEMWQIKKMSVAPVGNTIIRNCNKGIDVLSILGEDHEEAEEYRKIWRALRMDSKLENLKEDRSLMSCFSEFGYLPSGQRFWNVKSPKYVTTFSSDPVNNEWEDFAIEVFSNGGEKYFRYFDSKHILTFKMTTNAGISGYVLDSWEEHRMQVCPIVRSNNKISSDGVVTGKLELVKPVLDTYRQRSNSVSQAVYWSGTRTFVVENMDLEESILDAETGEDIPLSVKVMDSISMTDAGVVFLPSGVNGGPNPTLKQTEESNLAQLIDAKKDTLRDLARDTGLPYHLFDGTAVPTTAEGSIQAYNSHSDDKDKDKDAIGMMIEKVLSQFVYVETGEYKEFNVLWKLSEQVSINSLADTASKYKAAGMPLRWIAKYVLRGYHPREIDELISMLAGQEDLSNEQTKMIVDGI
jgi:hypothetical protein